MPTAAVDAVVLASAVRALRATVAATGRSVSAPKRPIVVTMMANNTSMIVTAGRRFRRLQFAIRIANSLPSGRGRSPLRGNESDTSRDRPAYRGRVFRGAPRAGRLHPEKRRYSERSHSDLQGEPGSRSL